MRLVATDLDGTLLRGGGTVSARTRRALARAAGVAVANAHSAVLAAADEMMPSNDEDGVAVAPERLLPRRGEPEGGTDARAAL